MCDEPTSCESTGTLLVQNADHDGMYTAQVLDGPQQAWVPGFRLEGVEPAVLAITVGGVIVVTAILSKTVKSIVKTRAQELSRREIAAYVAEGTIDPDKAAALLAAGKRGAEHHA